MGLLHLLPSTPVVEDAPDEPTGAALSPLAAVSARIAACQALRRLKHEAGARPAPPVSEDGGATALVAAPLATVAANHSLELSSAALLSRPTAATSQLVALSTTAVIVDAVATLLLSHRLNECVEVIVNLSRPVLPHPSALTGGARGKNGLFGGRREQRNNGFCLLACNESENFYFFSFVPPGPVVAAVQMAVLHPLHLLRGLGFQLPRRRYRFGLCARQLWFLPMPASQG